MLVLSRKRNQKIVVGKGENRVEIQVLAIRGRAVRIGVTAPDGVPIHRQEIYDLIHQEPEEIEAA